MGRAIDITVYLSTALGLLASIYLVLAGVVLFPVPLPGVADLAVHGVVFGLFPVLVLFLLRVKFVDYFRDRRTPRPESGGRTPWQRALSALFAAIDRVALLVGLFLELSNEEDKRLVEVTKVERCPPWMRSAKAVLQAVGLILFIGYVALALLHYIPSTDGGFFPALLAGSFGMIAYSKILVSFHSSKVLGKPGRKQ